MVVFKNKAKVSLRPIRAETISQRKLPKLPKILTPPLLTISHFGRTRSIPFTLTNREGN